ncbi:hypothetical protein JQC67_13890 [Aurantibacter crassamenti]|uniref:hypothetical protein n=1 Tax=Aurantibacter crassamenti TaxID=1837375 RepID=UPI00193A05EB|nr:hypothetical protein [Aurantibacter crassamenti]MBM1107241.1 hypothetical protein [Aurantibacter crassamenti]
MKLFKKLLKIASVLLGLIFIGFLAVYLIYNQPLPQSEQGVHADVLAEKMLTAINYDLYQQTRFLEWSFAGGKHNYKWDKENGEVLVKWEDIEVILNLNKTSKSTATKNGKPLNNEQSVETVDTALDYFNNDSYWLVAPFKIFDKGTTRSIVKLEDGSDGLLITYSTGGSTPGDSYLWKLNANGFPESYKMWVKIIPIGGLEATWNDWKKMENGLLLPVRHKIDKMTLDMGEVKAYN